MERESVKCYAIQTPTFNLSRRRYRKGAKKLSNEISAMPGFLAVDANTPEKGLFWIFETENDAKIAMNRLNAMDIPVSKNVGECLVEKEAYDELKKE